MHRELETAFLRTQYRVFALPDELILQVGRPNPVLAGLLHQAGVQCAAVLTAFNPAGRRSAPFRNRHAQRLLAAQLRRSGHTVLAGRNEDPRRRWPVEPTCLVLGLPLAAARRIAARYAQAAIVWADASGTPQLIPVTAPAGSVTARLARRRPLREGAAAGRELLQQL
jgi:hypothetical protein